MPIVNELIVSIVGGVATALILAMMTRGGGSTAAAERPANGKSRRFAGDFLQLILAVGGGIAFAMIGGRMLIQAGIVPKGLGTRLALLAGATTLIWFLLLPLRRG
ncbi:MAG: hypothetical protein AB7E80_13180 [Hyphomicrobiaceae bacterium]